MSASGILDKLNPHLIFILYCLSGYKAVDKKPKPNANHVECSFDNQPGPGQYCKVLAEELMTGPCTLENHYGYDKGKPCVIIKLNKVRQFFILFPSLITRSVRTFSLHKVRENCHFWDHPTTPTSLRNIKMAPNSFAVQG